MMSPSVDVMLEYKLLRQTGWKQWPITATEYFDVDYVANEGEFDIDDVPLYAHAVECLDIDTSIIENTKLTLTDNNTCTVRTIIETFWNGGINRVIERRDVVHGLEDYWEMIIDLQTPGEALVNEILRIGKSEGVLVLLSHVIITTAADGSQTELKIGM